MKKKIPKIRFPIRNIVGNTWEGLACSRNIFEKLWGDYIGLNPYCKGYSKGKTATEAMLYRYPCSSPLGTIFLYKTFKIFGIIIHIPAFWRRRKVKDISWSNEEDLVPEPGQTVKFKK